MVLALMILISGCSNITEMTTSCDWVDKIRPHRLDTADTKRQVLKLNDAVDKYRAEYKEE